MVRQPFHFASVGNRPLRVPPAGGFRDNGLIQFGHAGFPAGIIGRRA